MTGRDDPLGKRSLFSAPVDDAGTTPDPLPADDGLAPDDVRAGRRALFSSPEVTGPSVIVACRTCRARTPLSLADITRRLIPSLWLPLRPWSRWMRCPSCERFSWCRVEWGHLIAGG